MKRLGAAIFLGTAAVLVTVARGGHELPIYPSFYPHAIEIKTLAPNAAAAELRGGRIQAYLGEGLDLAGASPEQIRAIESLGSFIMARINPETARMRAEPTACDAIKTVIRELTAQNDLVVHPYPVTPFHGDYLYHADLAIAARARFAEGETTIADLKVKANGRLARGHPDWPLRGAEWDIELTEVDAAALMAAATFSVNGWIAPPWARTGWVQAERLLGDAVDDPARRERMQADLQRLKAGDFSTLVERTNL